MKSKKVLLPLVFVSLIFCACTQKQSDPAKSTAIDYSQRVTIAKSVLLDKIKGGWAGQVIGCTFGGPTEFKFCGTMIQDYTPIPWNAGRMQWYYDNAPGLYDDIYMDLTFVEVFEKEGLDAPAASHASAFANAGYKLWHANQAARYNILHGINPPESGHWRNNPHADDIDFQIEADFAGLMSPGMVNTASEICDKVGHIMNYGDGWYGGVYVAAMYSLAFICDDPATVVQQGLQAIPPQSQFYQCIADVIAWHRQFPDDWRRTWFEIQKKWSSDIGCPDGVFNPFNIDAKINAAYIVTGLLYGDGDYGRTIEIATRCGQDSDCNPGNAAGILGTILGYDNIPDHWKQGLDKVEDRDFKYTTMSLNDVYEIGLRHALQNIEKNGGTVEDSAINLHPQKPTAVRFEQSFAGLQPVEDRGIAADQQIMSHKNPAFEFKFTGRGFVVKGRSESEAHRTTASPEIQIFIDGKSLETADLPVQFTTRRHEICWHYGIDSGEHSVKLQLINPRPDERILLSDILIYGDAGKK